MGTNNFTKITIDGINFGDYSSYYVLNHMTKKKEPQRSDSFAMSNINSINQAEVPEIFISFKFLPMNMYRALFKITRKAEFMVEYYDQDYDIVRKNMFYAKDVDKLNPVAFGASRFDVSGHSRNEAWYGVRDYELNLVCTMNPLTKLGIQIYDSSQATLRRPYYINLTANVQATNYINIYSTSAVNKDWQYMDGEITPLVAGTVKLSFTTNKIKVIDADEEYDGIYEIDCSGLANSPLKLKADADIQSGEYVMFVTAENSSSQSITESVVIKVEGL